MQFQVTKDGIVQFTGTAKSVEEAAVLVSVRCQALRISDYRLRFHYGNSPFVERVDSEVWKHMLTH